MARERAPRSGFPAHAARAERQEDQEQAQYEQDPIERLGQDGLHDHSPAQPIEQPLHPEIHAITAFRADGSDSVLLNNRRAACSFRKESKQRRLLIGYARLGDAVAKIEF